MDNLQHPDITAAERTGYPCGVTEAPEEPEETKPWGIAEIYVDTMAAFEAAEKIMKSNAADLTEILNATVIAIRNYGVQIADEHADFVLAQPGARIVAREGDTLYPWEAQAEIDGVTVLALMKEAPNESAV